MYNVTFATNILYTFPEYLPRTRFTFIDQNYIGRGVRDKHKRYHQQIQSQCFDKIFLLLLFCLRLPTLIVFPILQ